MLLQYLRNLGFRLSRWMVAGAMTPDYEEKLHRARAAEEARLITLWIEEAQSEEDYKAARTMVQGHYLLYRYPDMRKKMQLLIHQYKQEQDQQLLDKLKRLNADPEVA